MRYGSWSPIYRTGSRLNQYDHALATIRSALSDTDIDGDGVPDRFVPAGIIWMQGESDAHHSQEVADAYNGNLTLLMRSLRAELGRENLPIVVGKITDSGMADGGSMMEYIGTVQSAQAALAAADECTDLVAVTDELNYQDAWHYDTQGFIRLGTAFAEAVLRLEQTCT